MFCRICFFGGRPVLGEHEGVHDVGPLFEYVCVVAASCCGSVANVWGAAFNSEVAVIAVADSLEHRSLVQCWAGGARESWPYR